MCGGCRVLLGDKSKFACVDGPGVRRFNGQLRGAHAAQFHVSRARSAVAEEFRAAQQGGTGTARAELAAKESERASEANHVCRKSTLPHSAMNVLPLKERMKILRRHMPELDPKVRSRNFEEVNLGLEAGDAFTEASRCIDCAKPGCVARLPGGRQDQADGGPDLRGRLSWPPRPSCAKTTRCRPSPAAFARRRASARADASWARKARRWPSATSSGLWPTTSA